MGEEFFQHQEKSNSPVRGTRAVQWSDKKWSFKPNYKDSSILKINKAQQVAHSQKSVSWPAGKQRIRLVKEQKKLFGVYTFPGVSSAYKQAVVRFLLSFGGICILNPLATFIPSPIQHRRHCLLFFSQALLTSHLPKRDITDEEKRRKVKLLIRFSCQARLAFNFLCHLWCQIFSPFPAFLRKHSL